MLWLKQTVFLLYFIHFCNGNNGLQKPGRSLVIVFDVTSSMATEIEALSAGVQILMDDFVSRKNNPIENYIFVQFRDDELDPELIPIFISSNYSDVKEKLQTLVINDGKNGDCAESSYNGIKRGLEVTNEDSIFFIITDAGTKRHDLLPEIHRLIAEKRAQLYFFVSMGGCDQQNFLLDYYNLAATSNGVLFQILPEEINDIFPTYRHLITTDGFISNSIAGPEGNSVYDIAIDKSMKEFTFTISAEQPVIQFYDPNSILLSDSQLQILLDLPSIKIIKIEDPISGIWKLEIHAESQFTGQVSVISDLQLIYGFSRYEPDSLKETNPYPLKGEDTFLAIQPSNPFYLNDLEYVMLVTDNTQIKHNLKRKETPDGDIFLTEAFAIPTETFKVVLHGKDPTKNIIERLLTPNIGANLLIKLGATIVPMISVKEGEPIYLICGVISAANVTISWSKVGVNSKLKSFSSIQSNILNYTINKAEMSDAGDYKCTAENSVGVTESISKVKVLAIPVSVNIEQTSITILTGEQFIELKCDVLPNFPSVINTTTWLFNQKTDLPLGSELNGTNLILRDIKPKFSGTYTCLAVKSTEQKSANVQLNVQYPPKFVNMLNLATNSSIDITQPIGVYDKSLLNINCLAEGNPEPSIKWIKNAVVSASNTSVLNINGNDVTQSGNYSCQIKSTLDEVEQKIIVDIVIPPKLLPTFKRIHKVKLGGSFQLECPLEIIPNNYLTITWFQNRTLLNQDSYLTWLKVNHDTNGEYKCVAENKAGKVDGTIHINVIYEPSILKITKADDIGTLELDHNTQKLDIFNTSTLSLTCTVNGNPEPIISWIKEGNIISTGKTITINDTKFDFMGPIECSAQNELKSVSRTITLNQIKIPKMQDPYQNVYNLTEHQPFTVSCPVEFGEYEVTWTLNGKSLEHFKQMDNSILISSVTETGMDGNAVCKVTNKAGTVWANLTFNVLRAPYDLSGTANNKTTLMENKTLEITCFALGNPTPNIYWSKDSQHHSNISSILFTSLQSKDTANYTCTAINILGKQSKTFEVIVGFPPRIPYGTDLHRTATNTNITILKLDNLPNFPVDYYSAHYKKLVQFNVGDDVLLKCPINGYPEPKIEWSNNSNNILNWSNKTLRFDNIAISDNGIYKCVGKNPYGQLEIVFFLSAQVQFIDTNKPFEIFDHSTHQLLCVYEGISSKIHWSSSTQTIVSKSSILILNGNDTSTSGDYYCQIETDSGMKTQPLNVDIVIKVKPLDSYNKILEAQLGHPLVLECPLNVISNNKWKISWYHNGMLVHQNTAMDNKYNIPSVGHNNNGIYKCRTENKARSMEIVLTVNVTYEPSIINLERIDDFGTSMVEPNQNLLEIYNTSSFRLVCHVNGNPNPTTIWKKNNVEISMTNELNINTLTLESLDQYQCFTKNKLNSVIRDLTLKVITKPSVLPNYPKLVKLTENEPFTMTCPMKNGDFNVKWFLDENSIDTFKQSNESIKFNVVTPNLAGDVTCIATNKAGSTKAAFKFDVLMAPYDIVTTTEHNQIVNVSSNLFSITLKTTELLDLTCNAKGNPSPEIYWHKDGQQFSQEKSISIASVTSDDRGNYVCIAKNYLGEKTDSFDVIINSRPQLLDVANLNNHQGAASVSMSVKNMNVAKKFFDADYQRNIEFNVGEPINLDCRMDGNPPPEIDWFKNDIRVNERNQIFVKLKSTPDDVGIYKCIRTNKFGATKVLFYVNEATNLVNNTQPIEIYDRAVKYIMCAYSGKTTNVKWINQNGETISKTPVLTIDGSDADQTGEYICQMGKHDQNILVEVTVEPKLLSSYPHEHSIKLGEPFTLPCPLVVVPGNKIDIKWSHNNLNLQNFNQNVSLRFPSVGQSDNGIYKCTAKNKAGIVDAKIKLDILYGPSILKIERSDDLGPTTIDPNEQILEVYNTKNFNLICHADGNPAPSIIWKKDGIEISSTFILKVNHISQFSGNYECFTENTLSSAVKSIKLKKIESPKALPNYSLIKELVLKKPFTMSCPMESGEYNVTWLLDDDSIDQFKQPDQTIAIDSVQSQMKGKVKCIATNKAGSAFAVFDFEIFEPPIDIRVTLLDLSPINSAGGPYQNVILLKENDSFGLICTSGGNPLPDFRWNFNQKYFNTGKTISFPSIQFQDSGDYTCIASNVYGTRNITYTIQVNVPMKAEVKTLSKGSNKNEIYSFGLSVLNHIKVPDDYFEAEYQQHISINETETLILDCTMSEHPVPSIQWYKNNKKLDTQKGSIATYKNSTIQDSGIYKCIGSQKHKKIRILFYVLVRQMFSIDSLTSSQSDYNVGDVISIYCKAKGNPIPVITFSGPKLSTNSEPTIIQLTNGANYFQQQNETFYMNKQRKIIDVKDLGKEAQYNIITYEFRDGQFVATLNHRIKSATNNHQGTYTCSVFDRNNKANKIRETIRINMLKPPYVDESAAKSVYFILENVKEFPIDCPIKGTPTPSVEWFRDTKKLSKSKTFNPIGNQLRIERPSPTKTGEYSCKHVTTSLEYKFKIQIIQSKVDLTKANLKNFKQTDIFIEKGETKQLNCTLGGKNIFWNEISDQNKREAFQLVVNPVYTIVGDLPRTLMCTNKIEPTYGELFNITVLGKPKIVATDDNLKIKLGTNFTLNCEAIGNPEPTTNWYKNIAGKWEHISKVTDFQQTSKFVVTKLKAQTLDESQYKCIAENRFGNVTKKFTVKVLDESHYFMDWGAWSECSKTCGDGIQKKSRQCIDSSCNFMIDSREQGCKIVDCPRDGGWSNWKYSKCSKPCVHFYTEKSLTLASRKCNNPTPFKGGRPCRGQRMLSLTCYVPVCQSNMENLTYTKCEQLGHECCPDTFQYNNKTETCEEVRPCERKGLNSVCNEDTQICKETGTDAFQCECMPGFKSRKKNITINDRCFDVNECRLNPNPCGNENCINTKGSFYCIKQ